MPLVRRRSEETLKVYETAMKRFLSVAGQKIRYSEEDIEKVANALERKGYKSSYIGLVIRVAKARIGSGFPDVFYKVDRSTVSKPTLSGERLRKMIHTARSLEGNDRYLTGYLLMSTLYGMRRSELSLISDKDIDLGARSLFVRTVKKGVQRYHLIPDFAVDILNGISFDKTDKKMVGNYFLYLCSISGIDRKFHSGWHSIRRALVSGLIERGVDHIYVRNFMRWNASETMEEYVVSSDFSIDRKVFDQHPFIGMWRD